MTRQPTIKICLFFLMTIDTECHLKIFPFKPVHCFYRTMALAAINLFFHMALMVKKYVFRDVVDFHPRRRGLCIEIFVLFLDLRVTSNNILMAVKTFFHRRYAREAGPVHIRVAEAALNLLYSGMHPMTERNGLLRAYV